MVSKFSVLQISPFFRPNIGGVETHLDDLLRFFKKRGIKDTVITYQALVGVQKGKVYENQKNIEIYRIPWLRGIFYKTEKYPLLHFFYLTPYLALRSLLLMTEIGKKIDIIHAHGINAAVVGSLIKKLFNKPLVVSLHVEFNLPKNSLSTKFILFILKKADYILVLTKRSQEELVKLGIDINKIKLFSYWVNQQSFRPHDSQTIRKKLNWDKRYTVLFVGRLAYEKGVQNLLNVAKEMPDTRFVLVGSGSLEGEVKKASREYKNIVYPGRVPNNKLIFYYNASDVLIVPSVVRNSKPEFEEGIPRVIIEALSCGLPVVGTDNGGIKEVILQGKVGEVCESNAESLASVIKNLSNPNKIYQYKKRARQYALGHFSESNGYKILEVYKYLKAQTVIKSRLKTLLQKVGDMALKRRAQSVIGALDLNDGKKILDAGCGDGFYLHLLSNLGMKMKLQLVGLDVDIRSLESAKRNLGRKKIPLIQGDLMERLPFTTGSFDIVVMSEVAEHLPDDIKGLKELYRVLKPGSTLLLTVPCRNYPFLWDPLSWILQRLFNTHIKKGFWAGIWNQHIRLYSLEQVNSVLKSAGFIVEKSEVQTFWCIPFNHYILNLGARLLTGGYLPDSIKDSASKFSENSNSSINLTNVFFATANLVDKLNKIFPVRSSGVSIFAKAKKVK